MNQCLDVGMAVPIFVDTMANQLFAGVEVKIVSQVKFDCDTSDAIHQRTKIEVENLYSKNHGPYLSFREDSRRLIVLAWAPRPSTSARRTMSAASRRNASSE